MLVQLGSLTVSYSYHVGGGTPIVLLHGWGCDASIFNCVADYLIDKNHSVIGIDLPGFGQSAPPPAEFTVYDYADTVRRLMSHLDIHRAVIAGHSFGGRLGIILAATTDIVEKLILIDAAGLKPRRGIRYRAKVAAYKFKKRLGLNTKNSGSADYRALSGDMKRVFVSVVNTHLGALVKRITCPTLIFFGALDRDTPLWMGKKLERNIADSALIVLKNAGHYSFLEQFSDFIVVFDAFIGGGA